jgi:hypothetical protein
MFIVAIDEFVVDCARVVIEIRFVLFLQALEEIFGVKKDELIEAPRYFISMHIRFSYDNWK